MTAAEVLAVRAAVPVTLAAPRIPTARLACSALHSPRAQSRRMSASLSNPPIRASQTAPARSAAEIRPTVAVGFVPGCARPVKGAVPRTATAAPEWSAASAWAQALGSRPARTFAGTPFVRIRIHRSPIAASAPPNAAPAQSARPPAPAAAPAQTVAAGFAAPARRARRGSTMASARILRFFWMMRRPTFQSRFS